MATGGTLSNTQQLANTLLGPIQADIQGRINTLNAKSPPPQDIINKYNDLNQRAENIKANTTDDYITASSKISALQSDLTTLNIQTTRAVRKGGSGIMGDIFEEVKLINSDLFILTSTLLGMLFGGIVASNWHIGKVKASPPVLVSKNSVLPQVKVIFYFIYGAVLFPLALLYGAFMDTPAWRSIIIPLFEVSTLFYNPFVSYKSSMNVVSYTIGKNALRIACYILLGCLAGTIYLINFNQ
jgi:hypothetical protein